MHVTQQHVLLPHPAMQEAFHEHLPCGGKNLQAEKAGTDLMATAPVDQGDPPAELDDQDCQQEKQASKKRYDKNVECHRTSVCSIRFICSTRFRVLTPLGHASWHFPQSMHFCTSLSRPLISPLFTRRISLRKLKSVNLAAVQVAAQVPHEIQRFRLGSAAATFRATSWLLLSKSICRSLLTEYPNLDTSFIPSVPGLGKNDYNTMDFSGKNT